MRFLRFLIVVVVALAFVLASPARGQGTSGQVPDPISTASLRTLLTLYVRPSPAEWETIESLHDDYREAFRALREGEIEAFLKEMQAWQSAMPTKRAMEEFMRKHDRLQKRIEQVDDMLFDGVLAIIGEERRSGVDRARDARARERAGAGIFAGMYRVTMRGDVSAITLELELPPEELEAVDPVLRSYEQSLTSMLKNLNDQTLKGFVSAFDVIDQMGLGGLTQEEMMADPERMQQIMEAMQEAFKQVGERSARVSGEIADLNTRTFRSVLGRIGDEETKRRFRVRYAQAAYPELAWSDQSIERIFRSARRMRSLDTETQARVDQLYASWRQADDVILDGGMKTLDDFNRGRSPFDFDPSIWEEHQKTMQDFHQRRSELANKYRSELSSLISAEHFQKLVEFVSKGENAMADPFSLTGDPEEEPALAMPAVRASEWEEDEPSVMGMGGDATAIGISFIAVLADRLGLDAGGRAVLETLHSDYLKRWEEEVRPLFRQANEVQSRIWRNSDDGAMPRPDVSAQNEWFARLSEAAEKVMEVDRELFFDAEQALGDQYASEFAVARLERVLAQSPRSQAFGYLPFGARGRERVVNIPQVIKRAQLSREEEQAALAVVAAGAEELIQTQRRLTTEALDAQRRLQDISLRMQDFYRNFSADNEEAPSAESMRRMQEFSAEMMRVQAESQAVVGRQVDAVRELYTAALAPLDESRRASLEFAYEEAAYPGIFRDDLSAMPFVERAAGFSDLTADQRTRLDALRTEYGTIYLDLCRRMIPPREAPNPNQAPEANFAESMRLGQEMGKLRFERDERSARAVSQLQRILTEEQARRIPGLDAYESRSKARNASQFDAFE